MRNLKHPLTTLTGKFGDNAEGGWWAVRWTFDGREGYGTGATEREALTAAERNSREDD